MPLPISDKLERRRIDVEHLIRRAFHGVSRQGGVSWSMADAIDGYGTSEELYTAGLRDRERCWEDLLNDRSWDPEPGVGGFVFLDATGFRYYIPVAMIWCLKHGDSGAVASAINRGLHAGFNAKQLAAIAAFVAFMNAWNEWQYTELRKREPWWPLKNPSNAWRALLDAHWHQFLN